MRRPLLTLVLASVCAAQAQLSFDVRFDPALQPSLGEEYSGRVYVAMTRVSSAEEGREPRLAMHDWFDPAAVFAQHVTCAPDGTVRFHHENRSMLVDHGSFRIAGECRVQAIARVDPDAARAGLGRGDLVSEVHTLSLPTAEPVELTLVRRTTGPAMPEDAPWESLELRSELLSEFHGRDVFLRAAVVLPDGWEEDSDERYPSVWFVMGFGQDHIDGAGLFGARRSEDARRVLLVLPDPTCGHGHSVFTDSPANGPYGRALVEELVPAIETRFRGGGAEHRYVTGGSSGGWAALSLQVEHPDAFAGCWSFMPDPVDFRSFLGADLYAEGANVYDRPDGEPRAFMTFGGRTAITVADFARREQVLGRGGQLGSLEATFSPLVDGVPRPLFDRRTGRVDPLTVEAWRAHDLSLRLSSRWDELGLDGKLHVIAGDRDEFDLDGAVALLGERLAAIGADAQVEVVAGLGHRLHQPALADLFATALARWRAR